MYKKLALQMLLDPPEEATFLNGMRLDVLKNEKVYIDIGFYKVLEKQLGAGTRRNSFIVTFNSEKHAQLNKQFFKAGRESITASAANIFVHNLACNFTSEILGDLFTNLIEYQQDNPEYFQTSFIGAGIPACLAVMAAAASPPHNLFTFGMPGFSTERPFREIAEKAYDRKNRHRVPDELPINQQHYVLPSDGTYRIASDYHMPKYYTMANFSNPSLWQRIKARFTSIPRRGLNLKAYENTSF